MFYKQFFNKINIPSKMTISIKIKYFILPNTWILIELVYTLYMNVIRSVKMFL